MTEKNPEISTLCLFTLFYGKGEFYHFCIKNDCSSTTPKTQSLVLIFYNLFGFLLCFFFLKNQLNISTPYCLFLIQHIFSSFFFTLAWFFLYSSCEFMWVFFLHFCLFHTLYFSKTQLVRFFFLFKSSFFGFHKHLIFSLIHKFFFSLLAGNRASKIGGRSTF